MDRKEGGGGGGGSGEGYFYEGTELNMFCADKAQPASEGLLFAYVDIKSSFEEWCLITMRPSSRKHQLMIELSLS